MLSCKGLDTEYLHNNQLYVWGKSGVCGMSGVCSMSGVCGMSGVCVV